MVRLALSLAVSPCVLLVLALRGEVDHVGGLLDDDVGVFEDEVIVVAQVELHGLVPFAVQSGAQGVSYRSRARAGAAEAWPALVAFIFK